MTWKSVPARFIRRRRCARSDPSRGTRPMCSPRVGPRTAATARIPIVCSTTTSSRWSLSRHPTTSRSSISNRFRRSVSIPSFTISASSKTIGKAPTLGAWGLGWECWCDGMEVSQFTYFQQVAGFECAPVSGELTFGLERLAMYVQGVDRVFDLNFNGREGEKKVTYGDVFLQAEQEYSRHNFEFAETEMLFEQFKMAEAACRNYIATGWTTIGNNRRHLMALPAYDQCIKASHVFNLLDARGVISVTERQSYILRVRELAKACGEAWLATEAGGALA